MSNDLISRSALIKELEDWKSNWSDKDSSYEKVWTITVTDYFEKLVKAKPTAYDVDNVVKQLKKEITKEDNIPVIQKTWNIAIKKAIEIVKAGGVNE